MEKIDKLIEVVNCIAWLGFSYYIAKLIATNTRIFLMEREKQNHELEMLEKNHIRQETEYNHQKEMKKLDYEHKLAEIILKNNQKPEN